MAINHTKNRQKPLRNSTSYNNNAEQLEIQNSQSGNSDDHSEELQRPHTNTINYNNSTGELYNTDINTSLQQPKPAQALTINYNTNDTYTEEKEATLHTATDDLINCYQDQPSPEAI